MKNKFAEIIFATGIAADDAAQMAVKESYKNLFRSSWAGRFAFACIFCLAALPAFAQHALSGKVRDQKTAVALAGASVYIPDLKVGAIAGTDGSYMINTIPDGSYLVEVRFLGYATLTREANLRSVQTLDFDLEPSSAEQREVVVTGVATATEQQTNPAPVSIVTQKTLLQTGSNNIIDALRFSPGVSQITEGPAISKPVIRGLGYNRVVTVNDGVRQEGQQFGDEFGIEVDPYSVERVEILRGPASLSYGSDAMAGVINFLSAPAMPEGQAKGSVLLNYQTNNGLYGLSTNVAGNYRGLSYDARFTYTDAHAYQNKYDGYVFNSGYGQFNSKLTLGLNRKWGYSRLTISAFDLVLGIIEGGRDSATGLFTKHILEKDGSDGTEIVSADELKSYNHDQIIHQYVRHAKVVWDNNLALGEGRLGVRLGFQQNNRQEANDVTVGNVYNIYYHLNTLNYDGRYTLPKKDNFEISFGANGMAQVSRNLGSVFLVPEYHIFDVGLFAIGKKTYGPLTLSGGLRFDNRSLRGDDLYIDSSGLKQTGPGQDNVHRFTGYSTNFSGFSGSIGAAYNFTKSFYGKLNLSRGFRAPNIAESGSDGIHDGTPFYEIGDPYLKPESSLQLDATLGINSPDVTLELNLFTNHINNYIFPVKLQSVAGGDSVREDAASHLEGPTFKYVSGDAALTGGEAVFNYHPSDAPWFRFNNTFSALSAIQQNQPDSTKYLPYTPPYKLISGVELVAQKMGGFLANAYLRADVAYYFEQDKIYYKYGNETVTPGYSLLNVGAGADVGSSAKKLFSVYIYGNNILDESYQSNMSRLKYSDTNNATGRVGVFEMGRNISLKILVPF